ncbi:MAG: twitching motility protein PilT [Acidimicrobiales bacterium]
MIVYDAGALIAAERGRRPVLALHTRMLQRRLRPVVPATVLAQVWRGGPQASLSRVLSGCRIEEGFAERDARRIGTWLARSGITDVVDAHVVAVAGRSPGSVVYTEDVGDLRRIAGVADQPSDVLPLPKGL